MSGQSLSPRIGQASSAGTYAPVIFVTNSTLPQAPWDGMLVYNTDVSQFQIYSFAEGGWLDPFLGQFGNQTYVGPDEPTDGMVEGDLWIMTPENALHRYDGTDWVLYDDPRVGNKTTKGPTPHSDPTPGDTWIDELHDNHFFIYDGTAWSPATTDGLPPTQSPEVTVKGGINSLMLTWPPQNNQSPVKYEVHISTAGPAFSCTMDTKQQVVEGNFYSVSKQLVDGTQLYRDTIYYGRVICMDDDGQAAPGIAGYDTIKVVQTSDIAPGAITSGEISDFAIPVKKLHSLTHMIY